jgi:hypothetical protein
MACELGSHASVDLLQAGADKRVVARLDAALEAVVAGEDFEIGIRLGEGMDAFVVAVVAVHVTLLVVLLGLLPPHRLSSVDGKEPYGSVPCCLLSRHHPR